MTPRRLSAALLTAMLAGPVALVAQDPASAERPGWEFAAYGYWYPPSDGAGFLLPILYADRGALHLELRYNYEDLNTGSLFVGHAFSLGRRDAFTLTPVIGLVAGRTGGIAPGLELEAKLGPLVITSENEYLVDIDDPAGSFLYTWTELSVRPVEPLRLGLVGQRTRTRATDLEIERGVVVSLGLGKAEVGVYAFNPFSGAAYAVLSLGVTF